MDRIIRHFAPILFVLVGPWTLCAQEPGITASVDRNRIAAGERFTLTISLTNSMAPFSNPDLGGLVIVQGPFEGPQFTVINGRMTSAMNRQWVLTSREPGKYTIGAAQVNIGSRVLRTNPITIEVVASGARAEPPQGAPGARGDIFITIGLNERKAYVGQQVIATYKLYSRFLNIERPHYELPKLDGFWAEGVDLERITWEDQMETINGLQYKTAVLKHMVLFPQRAGVLRIEPMTFSCVVRNNWMSPGRVVEIRSNAVELTVQALPGNAPVGFNGAVGDLQLNVKAERTNVKADEAIDLSVRISGRSNLKLVDAPKLDLADDFETYDPKVVDKISVSSSGMSGSREFQYLLIPRHEGSYPLDGITFSYFDPKAGNYRTLRSASLLFEVAPGEGGEGGALVHRPRGRDVQQLEQDIRYIRTGDLKLRPAGLHFFGTLPWLAGMGTPVLAFALLLVWHQRRERAMADGAGMRRKQADKVARRRLRDASRALEQGDRDAFYTALSRALNGYIGDKLDAGKGAMDPQRAAALFASLPNGAALSAEHARLIDICDMARFAPGDERPRQDLYDEAAALIGRIERSLRP